MRLVRVIAPAYHRETLYYNYRVMIGHLVVWLSVVPPELYVTYGYLFLFRTLRNDVHNPLVIHSW